MLARWDAALGARGVMHRNVSALPRCRAARNFRRPRGFARIAARVLQQCNTQLHTHLRDHSFSLFPQPATLKMQCGVMMGSGDKCTRDKGAFFRLHARARRAGSPPSNCASSAPAAAGDLAPCPAAAQTRACSTPTSANTSAAPTLRLVSAAPRRAARWPTALFAPSTAAARARRPPLAQARTARRSSTRARRAPFMAAARRALAAVPAPAPRAEAPAFLRTQEKEKRAGPRLEGSGGRCGETRGRRMRRV